MKIIPTVFKIYIKICAFFVIAFLPSFIMIVVNWTSHITWLLCWFSFVLVIILINSEPLKNQGKFLLGSILILIFLLIFRPYLCTWYADCFRPDYLKGISKKDKIIFYESDSNGISYIRDILAIQTNKNSEEILKEIQQFRKETPQFCRWKFSILYCESNKVYIIASWQD